uniref:Anaphase-promoting complex subunit 4 WD40 domain-containing protein n=1 Tax=Bionectria ochroleuca TaxID=29856 RepID=A0A8H7NC25_BIOOC
MVSQRPLSRQWRRRQNDLHLSSRQEPSPTIFGTNEPPPVENWKTYRRLIGHDNDVQDLAWSHDSSLLVSVGLDSKIVVWSGYNFEKLRVISAHGSHVKGITFDPANKFFATASDDRTIKIFRFTSPGPNATATDMVDNFVHEHTIQTPFKSSPSRPISGGAPGPLTATTSQHPTL